MKQKRTLLRIGYWVAAIGDYIVAVLVLIPSRMGVTEFVHPMGLTAAIAFSWGTLLIIADRKPVQRRWVLLPTMLVAFLLSVASVYTCVTGIIPINKLIPALVMYPLVLCLLTYTWFKTRGIE